MNTQALKAQRAELINQIRDVKNIENHDELLKQINGIDAQIKNAARLELLERVNREQAEKRELAAKVWQCEQPDTDITCNDLTFHSTKVKKYPNLAALQYARGKFEDGKLTEISVGREKFRMYAAKYEYNKPTEYTRPDTFEDFLKLNGIEPAPLTIEQYSELISKAEAANEQFQKAVKEFDRQKDALNLYRYYSIGLFEQQNAGHIYEFRAK